ncbi:hypothetical protein V1477_001327 [Vespula maculifrons]|uniref:Uncharacterized protein n=1 Tax=Vespula maculifrons TaxID=7453 RepID=A0ABD2CZH7_VESMC
MSPTHGTHPRGTKRSWKNLKICSHSPGNTSIPLNLVTTKCYNNGDSNFAFAASTYQPRIQEANWRRVSPRLRIADPYHSAAHEPTHDRSFIRFSNQTKSITVGLLFAPENTTPVPADKRVSVLSILPVFRADISRFAKKRKR